MQTIKVLYLNVLDIGCYSHTIDHVGGCFETPTAHFPNLHAVARKLSATQPTSGGSATMPQQITYVESHVFSLGRVLCSGVLAVLIGSVRSFKAAQMFVPSKVVQNNPNSAG